MNTDRPHHICPATHAGWLSTPLRRLIHNPERILGGLVRQGDTVIDLGCGPGFFSLPLAQLVGATGRVIAVELQAEMLEILRRRAENAELGSRIHLCHASPHEIGLPYHADFVLAFYVLHEVPDTDEYLGQVHNLLKEDGRFLLVEPWGIVPKREFRDMDYRAEQAGFVCVARPRIAFSRARLFRTRSVSVPSERLSPLRTRSAIVEVEEGP